MRKFLLYSSALALGLSGVAANAACIQTPTCSSLGYTSTSSCTGGTKCPFGNYWNCTAADSNNKITELTNKITELETTIEKIQKEEALSKCKIGDILYSDMSCNTNMIASKIPIGVVFDVTNGLAIAKDEFAALGWGNNVDISGIQNYASTSAATADWQGFNNTKAISDYENTQRVFFPAVEKVLSYSTEGTSQGQWYLPAAGELKAISDNVGILNTTLSKIGGTQMMGYYWTSSEQNQENSYYVGAGAGVEVISKTSVQKVKPIINFASNNKIEVEASEITCDIGDVLYSDKKCYKGGLWAGKTPIGVVFDASHRLALALEESPSSKAWSTEYSDFSGIKNNADKNKAKQDYNGRTNTTSVIAESNLNMLYKYPAFEYVNSYKTEGTQAGDWYLPALGELNEIYQNKSVIDTVLKILGKKSLHTFSSYWSSSEYSGIEAWNFTFSTGNVDFLYKDYNSLQVRPVLAF